MYIVTRGDLLEQYLRETGRASDDQERARRFLIDAWRRMWAHITATGLSAIGQVLLEIPIAAPSATEVMPADFMSMIALAVYDGVITPSSSRRIPEMTSYRQVIERNLDRLTGLPQYYLIEGPRYAPAATPAPTTKQLRFYGPLVAGNTIQLAYITHPPDLGDPTNPADDAIEIDMGHFQAADATVQLARVRSATREDRREQQTATTEVLATFDEALIQERAVNRTGPHSASLLEGRPGWVGYR